jgi:hypothetical protein
MFLLPTQFYVVMKKKVFSIVFLLMVIGKQDVAAQIVNYNWPTTAPKSDKYEVTVKQGGNTQTVYTHFSKPNGLANPLYINDPFPTGVATQWQDRTMSYAIFAFTGVIDIEVKKNYGAAATRVDISPKAFGINPYFFDGTTVKFRITDALKPAYISVNFITSDNQDADGNGGLDIKHGMMIFADKPEVGAPQPTDPGVVVYSEATTYAQMQAASTLYFPPGDWNLLTKITDQHGNLGRYHVLNNNQRIYFAGGAFVRGSIDADGKDNLKFFGRGIFTGVDYYFHQMLEPNGTTGLLEMTAWVNLTGSNNCTYEGISMVYPCHHTCPSSNNTTIKNLKIIGWAFNNDGIRPNTGSVVEEIFIKTNDDYDYARDLHVVRNSIFWPSKNGASGQLGWNNLGVGKTTYENMYYINSEWSTYGENRGVLGSKLTQGVALANDTVRNCYGEDFTSLLSNLTIKYDAARTFDVTKPGEVKDFLFKNIIFENTFKANNGSIIKQPLRGFSRVVSGVTYKATVHDITFTNLVIGNVLVTQSNASTYFDIDANTAYNIFFNTDGNLHNVSATALANGRVSPSGVLPTPEGMRRVVNIIPNAGYKIKDVRVNGVSVGRVQHYLFNNVTAPQIIEAEFEAGNDYFDLSTTLPVKWLSFSGRKNNKNEVELVWRVSNEINVAKYLIERSADGVNFNEISSVFSTGSQTLEKRYTHVDINPLVGSSFYKIKQIDNDNRFSYSTIVKIENKSNNKFSILPNPAHGFIQIKSNVMVQSAFLTQADGKRISIIPTQGLYNISGFSKGWYTITIVTEEGMQSQALLIN